MAVVTGYAGREVAIGYTPGIASIVTAIAGTDDLIVIDRFHRFPGAAAVAVLAIVRGRRVIGTLAIFAITIVATIAADVIAAVLEIGRRPTTGAMAEIAGVVADNVILRLTVRHGTVVATGAGTDDLIVINPDHRRPIAVAVAILACVGGRHVGIVFSRLRSTVMTAETVAGHLTVFKGRWDPLIGRMAKIAGIVAGDVVLRLAVGIAPVMAAVTDTQDLVVIDPGHR